MVGRKEGWREAGGEGVLSVAEQGGGAPIFIWSRASKTLALPLSIMDGWMDE